MGLAASSFRRASLFSAVLLATSGFAAQDCRTLLADARRAYEAKSYAAAEQHFERAAAICPNAQPILLDLAKAQLLDQQLAACQKTLARILAASPRDTAALKLKADAHYLAGEDREAEQALLSAIDIDPRNQDAHYALGRAYYQQNRYEDAVRQFQKVLELNPQSYKAYDNLGLCYEALNDTQQAIRHYLKALDLVYKDHPEYDWPYGNLANLMLKLGDYRKAFDLAAEASKRNPGSARNCFLTGKALVKLDKTDLSVRWLKRAIELDPNYPEPRYLLAQVYKKQGLNGEAQKEFKAFQNLSANQPRNRR